MQKTLDCEYHDYEKGLIEQFIHESYDEVMIGEILRDLTLLKDINEAMSDQILVSAQRVEAQRVQKRVLDHIREDKEFDSIR